MPEPEGRAAAVVLAAGSSTRLGRNKLLLDAGGESLVRRAVETAHEAGLDPVYVVLGHEAELVRKEIEDLPCSMVLNPRHSRGAGSSLKVGVAAAGDARALVVMLADMPFVTAEMLRTLVSRWRETGAALVVSRYGADVEAPPNLFTRALVLELLAGDDERCAKGVVNGHREEAVFVSWPEESLRDIDVPGDYERVRALLAR